MRYNLAPCSLLLCFLLGGIFAGCKSVATTFHRMHDEITSELIKEDADEDSHYYGAWFTWSASFDPKEQLLEIGIAGQQKSNRARYGHPTLSKPTTSLVRSLGRKTIGRDY
jgi:hypothetical protein